MAASVTTASGATWKQVAADRQRHRDATIAAVSPPIPEVKDIPLNTTSIAKQVLTSEEIRITENLVENLVQDLATGAITSTIVTKAFLRRAALAQQAVCSPLLLLLWKSLPIPNRTVLDELYYRTPPRTSAYSRCLSR